MNFANGKVKIIYKLNEVGEAGTIPVAEKMMDMGKVIIENSSGKLDTNVQTMHIRGNLEWL